MNYAELFQKVYQGCEVNEDTEKVTVQAIGYDRPDLQLIYEKMQLPTNGQLEALRQLDSGKVPQDMGYACTKELVDSFGIAGLGDYAGRMRILAGAYDYTNAAFYVDLFGIDKETWSTELLVTLPCLPNDTVITVACAELSANLGTVYHNRVRFFVLPLGFAVRNLVSRKALNGFYLDHEDKQLGAYRQITSAYMHAISINR